MNNLEKIREQWEVSEISKAIIEADLYIDKYRGKPKGYHQSSKMIADFFLSRFEKVLESIEAEISEELAEPEISYGSDVDITELPSELLAEMAGAKKAWKAGHENALDIIRKYRNTK